MDSLRVIPANAQHQGMRSEQQDAFAFSSPDSENRYHAGFLAVVADGMGGMSRGREAAHIASQVFIEAYSGKREDESIPDALKRAAFEANDAVKALAEETSEIGEVGTTLVAAVARADRLYWLSVGDSRIYKLDAESTAQLNEEHNLRNKLCRLANGGFLDAEEVEANPQKEALTSYIGIENLTEIDMPEKPLIVKKGDQIVLCSDGLYKSMNDKEIFSAARGALNDDPAAALVDGAMDKGLRHQDNITVLVLSFGEPEAEERAEEPPKKKAKARKMRRRKKTQRRPIPTAFVAGVKLVLIFLLCLLIYCILSRVNTENSLKVEESPMSREYVSLSIKITDTNPAGGV
ncbi:hypothetical protein FACS1894216_14560 [Synergistales bacterium]|nr:hypothetical protein FACS1894216_14560 [Synergistales bacterium]